MRKALLLIVSSGLFLGACTFTFNYDEGSGRVRSESRTIEAVSRVAFEGIGNLIISQGEPLLEIEAEDNILPRIVTEVRDDQLRISFDTERWENIIRPTKPITYRLQVPDLNELSLAGLGNVTLEQVDGERLIIRLSGAGSIEAAGRLTEQDINVSGAGSYDAGDLLSERASINLSGAGDAVLWVTDVLDVSITGLGNVSYYGDPAVQQSITGLGNIKALGEH